MLDMRLYLLGRTKLEETGKPRQKKCFTVYKSKKFINYSLCNTIHTSQIKNSAISTKNTIIYIHFSVKIKMPSATLSTFLSIVVGEITT